jgi:hypothetical protein
MLRETVARRARQSGGVKAKLGNALADDTDFIRKLKPRLIAVRARGEAPKRSGGMSPWAVVGVALVAGYVLAKTIDWRSHAHPRD